MYSFFALGLDVLEVIVLMAPSEQDKVLLYSLDQVMVAQEWVGVTHNTLCVCVCVCVCGASPMECLIECH